MSPARPVRLTFLPRGDAPTTPGRLLAADGAPLPRPSRDGKQTPHEIVVVPGEDVRLLWREIPARSAAQAIAAARLQWQDQLAEPLANLHIAVADAKPGEPRLFGVVAHARMQEWLQRCAQLGIIPDVFVPDCLLLDAPSPDASGHDALPVAAQRDGLLLVRGPQLAFTAEAGLAQQVLAGIQPQPLDEAAAERQFIANALSAPALNLLQTNYARRTAGASANRKRIAVLGTLVLLSPLLLAAAQTAHHAIAAKLLRSGSDTLARQIPLLADTPQPTAALHAQYLRLTAADTLAFQSAQLFQALDSVPGTHLDSLESSAATGLRAGVLHRDDAELQTLRERLTGSGLDLVPLDSQPVEAGLRSLIAITPLAATQRTVTEQLK